VYDTYMLCYIYLSLWLDLQREGHREGHLTSGLFSKLGWRPRPSEATESGSGRAYLAINISASPGTSLLCLRRTVTT
jgi:hypothetical protein